MKKFGILASLIFTGLAVFAQGGSSTSGPASTINNHDVHVAEARIVSTGAVEETLIIRMAGQGANTLPNLDVSLEGSSRIASFPMNCQDCKDGTGGNNGSSLWTLSVDADSFVGTNGDLIVKITTPSGKVIVKNVGKKN